MRRIWKSIYQNSNNDNFKNKEYNTETNNNLTNSLSSKRVDLNKENSRQPGSTTLPLNSTKSLFSYCQLLCEDALYSTKIRASVKWIHNHRVLVW